MYLEMLYKVGNEINKRKLRKPQPKNNLEK